MRLDPELVRRLCVALIDNLAALHSLDYKAAGLAELGKPDGYVARQVTGWIGRYQNARTDDLPAMDRLAPWLLEHMPKESGAAMIHNDYKFDNVMLDPADLTRIVAVFDWEMATVGDPLMDLGTSLGYWVLFDRPVVIARLGHRSDGHGRKHDPARACRALCRELGPRRVKRALLLLFWALQIRSDYPADLRALRRGFTKDERFATFNERVRVISEEGLRALESKKL